MLKAQEAICFCQQTCQDRPTLLFLTKIFKLALVSGTPQGTSSRKLEKRTLLRSRHLKKDLSNVLAVAGNCLLKTIFLHCIYIFGSSAVGNVNVVLKETGIRTSGLVQCLFEHHEWNTDCLPAHHAQGDNRDQESDLMKKTDMGMHRPPLHQQAVVTSEASILWSLLGFSGLKLCRIPMLCCVTQRAFDFS